MALVVKELRILWQKTELTNILSNLEIFSRDSIFAIVSGGGGGQLNSSINLPACQIDPKLCISASLE